MSATIPRSAARRAPTSLRVRSLRPSLVRTLVGVTVLAASSVTLQAQGAIEPSHRSPFHFSIGAGQGAVGVTCDGCDFDLSNRVNGFSGVMRIGGAVSNHLVLAAEGMGWIKNEAPIQRRIAAASVVALLYPSASAGFFVKAGLGYMRGVFENDGGYVASNGIAPQAGLGFDIPVGGGVALTPYVNALLSTNTSLDANGYNLPVTLNPYVVQAGMSLTVGGRGR